jgi:hypothetical protein
LLSELRPDVIYVKVREISPVGVEADLASASMNWEKRVAMKELREK